MKRAVGLLLALLLLLIPQLDQLVCAFCGPGPESTLTAKEVSHAEDECPLQDGFEREDPGTDGGPAHIHFCTLHSTFLDLAALSEITRELSITTPRWWLENLEISFAKGIDHPPQA